MDHSHQIQRTLTSLRQFDARLKDALRDIKLCTTLDVNEIFFMFEGRRRFRVFAPRAAKSAFNRRKKLKELLHEKFLMLLFCYELFITKGPLFTQFAVIINLAQ